MKSGQFGFTLLDLLTTVVVLGILLTVGIPSFSSIMRNNRIAGSTNELVTALTYARSEAMKRGDIVAACPSDDQSTCAGNNDWSTGWVVFVDLNEDGARDVTEQLLQVWQPIGGGLELDSSLQFLQYASTGLTIPINTNGSFELMKPGYAGTDARCIRIGNTGRIFTERETCS
ncbi:MAG: GspH/FimT family pseudopilin [Steroidobacteraceae bacterium]